MAGDLTPRQTEIADLLGQEVPVREIADRLGITRNAVYAQIKVLKDKGALDPHWTQSGEVRLNPSSRRSQEILEYVTGGPRPDDGNGATAGALEVIERLTEQNTLLTAQNGRLLDMVDRLSQ